MRKYFLKHWFALALIPALLLGLQFVPLLAQGEISNTQLASGKLLPNSFGIFNFTLLRDIWGSDALTIGTAGSKFDTEIALYDKLGNLVATNDNMTPANQLSQLNFGAKITLSAGDYQLVLGGFNTLFGDGNITPGTHKGGDFNINIESSAPIITPSKPSFQAMDGHILPAVIYEIELAQGRMEPGVIRRFDFTLKNDILPGDWFDLNTKGLGFDSEIGLYDSKGKLIANNDDISPRNSLSRLSFGLDGDNGRKLLAGDYTVLLGGFNTIFQDGLKASTSSPWTGDFVLYLQSSKDIESSGMRILNADLLSQAVPEPASILLLSLGLILLVLLRFHFFKNAQGRSEQHEPC